MKYRNLSFSFIAALAALAFALPANAVPVISVTPTSSTVAVGDTFSLDINISGVDTGDVYAFQFDVLFDAAVLNAIGVIEGSYLVGTGATFFIPGVADNLSGAFANTADTLLTAINGATGDGTLAQLTFKAIGSGISAISLANVLLLDSQLLEIGTQLQGGSVAAGAVTGVPEPAGVALFAMGLALVFARRRVRSSQS